MHMHTYYSDGTMSPEELVAKAKQRNVGVMAITDHNSIASWEAFQKTATEAGILPISGVEINAAFEDKILHILAYGFEPTTALQAMLCGIVEEMEQMSIDMVTNLEKVEPKVSLASYEAFEFVKGDGGWKGIQYLRHQGVTESLGEGIKYYPTYGKPLTSYAFPKLEEVCRIIQEAGGYAVLAHPATSYSTLSGDALIAQLEKLRQAGVQGVECYYPTHTEAYTATCVAFCEAHDLLITTGADEHGTFGEQVKTVEQTVGCMQIDKQKLRLKGLCK